MNAEIYKPLWINTVPSLLKSNYKTSNLSHKQQKPSSLGFLTIFTTHQSLPPKQLPPTFPMTSYQARQKVLWLIQKHGQTIHPWWLANQRIPNKRNNIRISFVFFFSESTAGNDSSLRQEPGETKAIAILSPPWKHSTMEPWRQLVATPSKVFAHSEKGCGCLCEHRCILSSEELWSCQSTTSIAVKMFPEWKAFLTDFLKVYFYSSCRNRAWMHDSVSHALYPARTGVDGL